MRLKGLRLPGHTVHANRRWVSRLSARSLLLYSREPSWQDLHGDLGEIAQSRVIGQEGIAAEFDGCGEMHRIDKSVDSAPGILIMTTDASGSVVDRRDQASCREVPAQKESLIAQKEGCISLPEGMDQAFAASQVADEEATAGGFQGPNMRLGSLLEGSLLFDCLDDDAGIEVNKHQGPPVEAPDCVCDQISFILCS